MGASKKQLWFAELIKLKDDKEKAEKAAAKANTKNIKAIRLYNNFSSSVPSFVPEGNFKYKGYLIEIDDCNDVIELELEPKYKKV